ncbi:MAG: hypothetical protein H6R25_407 [Proteobacteria bacterium]|nr:hypothetical protein [Pseudomonadota bacterium]
MPEGALLIRPRNTCVPENKSRHPAKNALISGSDDSKTLIAARALWP